MENIWEAKLDKEFDCKVERLRERVGHLSVTNTESKEVILDKDVDLSYGALFGPDVDDVAYWQDLCIEAVDEIRRHAKAQ